MLPAVACLRSCSCGCESCFASPGMWEALYFVECLKCGLKSARFLWVQVVVIPCCPYQFMLTLAVVPRWNLFGGGGFRSRCR